ncbi:MAG: hypothetical protein HY558_01985 [Euryarchaeota archaeon]|nr:hypothetical protein [Euryarchaeota archaeon]
MISEAQAIEKAFTILRRELSPPEYVAFLRAVTPRFKDSARELRERTRGLTVDETLRRIRASKKPTRGPAP